MNWAVAPLLLPLLTALGLLFGRPGVGRRWVAGLSATLQLGVALYLLGRTYYQGMVVLPLGGWAAPAGIVLAVDTFSAIMLCLAALISLACLLYGYAESPVSIEHALRLPLLQFLVMGINLCFCTGDLFNLYVGFEVMLIASYALLTLEADDWDIKQAYPYVAINLVGSALFLSAAGLAYGIFGTLNFADLAMRAAGMGEDPRVQTLAMLLLVVFGIKAGLFPLYYWLPNSYPTLPYPLAALYAGMLTKVGVYVLARIFGTVLPHDLHFAHHVLGVLGGLTMVIAVLGALSRQFIRGILSFHILSQIGFMVLAVGLFTPLSYVAAIFYIIHHIVVKASLFLIGGVAATLNGTDNLARGGRLWRLTPWLGILFLAQALSLAGLPPLSGFWGKYVILVVGLEQGRYILVGAALVASLLTLMSMLKIWNATFWSEGSDAVVNLDHSRWKRMTWVVGGLAVISLGIGLGAEGVMQVAQKAAGQVLDQQGYAAAVLGATGKGNLP